MGRFAAETLTPGAPLRTLYGLFAGSGTDVFNGTDAGADARVPPPRMVAQWRDNLAMMLANPTAGDTEVRHAPRGAKWWQQPCPCPCLG